MFRSRQYTRCSKIRRGPEARVRPRTPFRLRRDRAGRREPALTRVTPGRCLDRDLVMAGFAALSSCRRPHRQWPRSTPAAARRAPPSRRLRRRHPARPGRPAPSRRAICSGGHELRGLPQDLARTTPARSNLGAAYVRLGRLPEGIDEYRKALALDPASPAYASPGARPLQGRPARRGDRAAARAGAAPTAWSAAAPRRLLPAHGPLPGRRGPAGAVGGVMPRDRGFAYVLAAPSSRPIASSSSGSSTASSRAATAPRGIC